MSYEKNISNFMEDLRQIRLASLIQRNKKSKNISVSYQIEKLDPELAKLATVLNISDSTIRPDINFSV